MFSFQTNKLCLVFFFFGFSDAAEILGIFPAEEKSHFAFHKGIMDSLVDAGHKITVISPFPDSSDQTNFTYINSKVERKKRKDHTDNKSMSKMQFLHHIGEMNAQHCHNILQLKEVQNLLNSEIKVFDVMFFEVMPLYECFLPLAEKLGVPIIATFSMRTSPRVDNEFGNPISIAVPGPQSSMPLRSTFFGRIQNVLEEIHMSIRTAQIWNPMIEKINQKYFPNYNLRRDQISLLFTNNHASIFAKATARNVIDIPGIHLKPVKALPQSFKNYLDESSDGVILVSFGSKTKSTSVEAGLRDIFRETFADLPQRVIWKFEDQLKNLSANVLRVDWMPQRDILAHKNVKAFITHCGISGLYEAIDVGVPLIMIPLFGDQRSNAVLLDAWGVGIRLNFQTLTKEILLNSIQEVLYNKKYAQQMQKLSREFWNRPMTPQETIVYWTEYVIRHNGTGLTKFNIEEIPFYQYYLLDIIALASITLFTISFITHRVGKFIYKSL